MTGLLLDASVWLAALDADDAHHGAASQLVEATASGSTPATALDLTLYEVANAATVRWKSPSDAAKLVRLVLVACADRLERADEAMLSEAVAISAEHSLSVYDAAYVAACRRRNLTLVSGDLRDLVGPGFAIAPDAALM